MCSKNRKLIAAQAAYSILFQLITQILSSPTLQPYPQLKIVEVIESLLSAPDFLISESFPFIIRTLAELTNPHRRPHVSIAAIKRIIILLIILLSCFFDSAENWINYLLLCYPH